MPQFILNAYDARDAEAAARRRDNREAHLAKMSELKKSGNYLFGGALLDDEDNMIGSTIVYEFPDRAALEAYLKTDPYVIGRVWDRIHVRPFRVAKVA